VNLFAGGERDEADTKDELVTCAFLPDGEVTDFSSSRPRGAEQAIVRVYVRAAWDRLASDGGWRLHGLFAKKPSFRRRLILNQGTLNERGTVDLKVQAVWPLEDPKISDRDGNRVGVTFRVSTRHSRE
jgi:hypothetical protein